MKPVHQVLAVGGLLLLGAITWRILTLPPTPARWLNVEGPARVAPGEKITLRITVTAPDPSLQLIADLHGWTRRNHPLRAVGHATPQRLGPAVQPTDFLLTVPTLPDLATVRAIVYLSPTGNWRDQVLVAQSDEIPVNPAAGPPAPGLEPLGMRMLVPDPVIPRVESAFLRGTIATLWLVMALGLGWQMKQAGPGSAVPARAQVEAPTFALIVACLAAVLVEILGAEPRICELARQFALRHDLHERRHLAQQIAVLLTVVGLAAVTTVIILRARRRRLVCGLLAYAAISLTAILSLHETDALLYSTVLGLPVEQWAKLAAVALACWGLRSPPAAP